MAYVLHAVECPLDELIKQFLSDEPDDTTNTHESVDLLTIFGAPENLDSKVCIDKLARELLTLFLHNLYVFFKFTPFEVLLFSSFICNFVPLTMQIYILYGYDVQVFFIF